MNNQQMQEKYPYEWLENALEVALDSAVARVYLTEWITDRRQFLAERREHIRNTQQIGVLIAACIAGTPVNVETYPVINKIYSEPDAKQEFLRQIAQQTPENSAVVINRLFLT